MLEYARFFCIWLLCCRVNWRNELKVIPNDRKDIEFIKGIFKLPPQVILKVFSFIDDPHQFRLVHPTLKHAYDLVHYDALYSILKKEHYTSSYLANNLLTAVKLARRLVPLLEKHVCVQSSTKPHRRPSEQSTLRDVIIYDLESDSASERPTKYIASTNDRKGSISGESETSMPGKGLTISRVIEILYDHENRDHLHFFFDFLIHCGARLSKEVNGQLFEMMANNMHDLHLVSRLLKLFQTRTFAGLECNLFPARFSEAVAKFGSEQLVSDVLSSLSHERIKNVIWKSGRDAVDFSHFDDYNEIK